MSPSKIISFPSDSRNRRTWSNLSKVSTGLLGGLYHESIQIGVDWGGVISARINSNDDAGISLRTLHLKVSLI